MVRLRVLVPPWAPCGDDNLPGAANHSGGGALGTEGAGAAVRGHNELGLLPPALLGRGAGVVCDGAARVGNERKIHRGSGHGGGHGRHTRAPDALRGGRVRQRVHCDICNGADILHVGAITSQREVVADWAACRAQLRVHGGSMGRVYICAQYGRTARCTDSTAGLGEGCLQHTDTPQLHAVFYCWHMHSGMRTACGMDAV